MISENLELLQELAECLRSQNKMAVTAESCTGGGLAAALTSISGSSDWFERGWVAYSNAAKQQCLDVGQDMLREFGAVSKQCAQAMAKGALANSQGDIALSITGIAGPSGGTATKPVGLVWFGWAIAENDEHGSEHYIYDGDRHEVQALAMTEAVRLLLKLIQT